MVAFPAWVLVLILSVSWGIAYALILQFFHFPFFLAQRKPWVTVVAGVAVQCLIFRFAGPCVEWWLLPVGFTSSGVPVIVRSLVLEWQEDKELREQFRG